jgi:hypothetical protein
MCQYDLDCRVIGFPCMLPVTLLIAYFFARFLLVSCLVMYVMRLKHQGFRQGYSYIAVSFLILL